MVRLIGLELVSRVAPEELPLYPSLASEFGTKASRKRNASSGDQILGFGTGEAVMLITPVILSFTQGFWNALVSQAAESSIKEVVRRLQLLRKGSQRAPQDTVPLTADQLLLVRKVAEQETLRLNIPASQAGLLTDALLGALAVPPTS